MGGDASAEGGDSAIGEDRERYKERYRLLRVVVDARGKILQREGDGLVKVVWGLRGNLLSPHVHAERVTNIFGAQHNIDQFALLGQIRN